MVGGYGVLQNLVGVFFLTILLYFLVKWLENIGVWRKYGILTIILLGCNVLTHIYTGALALILFFSLMLFSIVFKIYKTGKLPTFDLKILGLLSILTVGCTIALFAVYPVMYSKLITVLSFFDLSSSTMSANGGDMGESISGTFFLSLPYLVGIFASIMILKQNLEEKLGKNGSINKNILLAWLYLTLAAVLAVMVFLPSQYRYRFVLIAFLPIALIVPLGLKYIETEVMLRKPDKKRLFML